MKNNTLILIVVILAAAVGAYFLLGKKKQTDKVADSIPPADAADEAAFQQMKKLLQGKIGANNMLWVLKDTKELIDTNGTLNGMPWYDDKNRINGKIPKSGALAAIYGSGVWPDLWKGKYNSKGEKKGQPEGQFAYPEDAQFDSQFQGMWQNYFNQYVIL